MESTLSVKTAGNMDVGTIFTDLLMASLLSESVTIEQVCR